MLAEILLISLSFAFILFGAIGVAVPLLPGVPMAWLGLLFFGYATDFSVITLKLILIFFIFTILTMVLDALMPVLGAKKYNASQYGILGSFLGFVIGIMFLGPIGIIVGPFAGVFIGEILSGRTQNEAIRSAKGALIGFLAGSAVKLALILVMLGFLIFALF
ncbi:MAG: DUF456 domain-containing protein [bacterium]|nr:DUF456 domain-containing protein [bacterium]